MGKENNISSILKAQRDFFSSGKTKPLEFRQAQLRKLLKAVHQHENSILEALRADMKKPLFEAYSGEVGLTYEEIKLTLKNLKSWMKPKRAKTPLFQFPASSHIYSEPLGVVLIIAPWNYPFQLLISPLVGAIAAGNCVVLKPSEVSGHTSKTVTEMIKNSFDPNYITALEGGVEITQALLKEKFDHIFFTGGTTVGKIIMEAEAKNL